MTRKLSHWFAAAGGLLLAGCVPLLNLAVPRAGYSIRADVAYGSDPRQTLDVYIPDHLKASAPVLLFFYGGSWQSGSKDIYRAFGQAFASRGIVTVVADYRVYPQVRYPAFLEDGAAAVAFVHAHAADYGGDPGRLFVSGHSAGAYIAVMLAVNDTYLKAAHADPAWIRGAIGLAGPYDFLPLADPALIDIFGGDRVMATQPIKYAAGRHPPMLLAHGTADTTVGAGNSRRMAQRLRAAGNTVELKEYAGVSHLGIILSLAPGLRGNTTLYPDMLAFIAAH
ncbi:MAG: alpha/beta hydrolase [Rhizomicrobium sp.]